MGEGSPQKDWEDVQPSGAIQSIWGHIEEPHHLLTPRPSVSPGKLQVDGGGRKKSVTPLQFREV